MTAAVLPTPPVQPAWKGAWGGAWTVAYGCVLLFFGTLNASLIHGLVVLSRFGAATVRSQAAEELGADSDLPARLASLIEAAPEALGASLRAWAWAGVLMSVVVVAAGIGVMRRSDTARRIAIAALVGTLVITVATSVWWFVKVAPAHEAWMSSFHSLLDDAGRQGGAAQSYEVRDLLPSVAGVAAWTATGLVFEAVAVVALTMRLAGPGARAWCAGSGQAIASAAGRR